MVDKKRYSSDQISFGQYGNSNYGSTDLEAARSVVRRYEKGQPVEVNFKPTHHSSSVLEPAVTGLSYAGLGISILIFATGAMCCTPAVILVFQLRRRCTQNHIL